MCLSGTEKNSEVSRRLSCYQFARARLISDLASHHEFVIGWHTSCSIAFEFTEGTAMTRRILWVLFVLITVLMPVWAYGQGV
jgi:hypothetical protein